MELETIEEIASTSTRLSELKNELDRYYEEEYLHDPGKSPTISVSIGNHPTYLRKFTVSMNDAKLRTLIVKTAIQQTRISIEKLEKELAKLTKKLDRRYMKGQTKND